MTWCRRLADAVEAYCGVRVREEGLASRLDVLLRQRMLALSLESVDAYVTYLQRHAPEPELARLVEVLTTPQTSFFRDEAQLNALSSRWTATTARPIDIWSAGCATGEEAYTLALLAHERGTHARILGTDINERCLELARVGAYTPESIAGLVDHRRARFSREARVARVRPQWGMAVRFERHNLVGDRVPRPPDRPGWDLILCRNVLIYFDRVRAVCVVERLASALVEGGWLALGAADPFVAGQVDLLRPVCVEGHWFHERRREEASPGRRHVVGGALLEALARGNELLAAHEFAGARSAYSQGLQLAPNDGEPAYLLGLLHRKEGDYAGAIHWFQRALRLRPSLWPARYLLGSCLDRSGRCDQAAVEFARVLDQLERGDEVEVLRSRLADLRGLVLPPAEVASVCRERLRSRSVPTPR